MWIFDPLEQSLMLGLTSHLAPNSSSRNLFQAVWQHVAARLLHHLLQVLLTQRLRQLRVRVRQRCLADLCEGLALQDLLRCLGRCYSQAQELQPSRLKKKV